MSNSAVTTLEPEPDWAAFVALDWGSRNHAWILQPAGHGQRQASVVDNTPEAVADWAADLNRRFAGRPVAIALEQKRGSVVNLLLAHPHLVLFPVPASMSASYRKTFVPSGAKDDPGDAAWILDLLLLHRDRLRRLRPDDANTRLLLSLVEYRRQLVADKTRLELRLQACLQQYFPQVLQWFDVDTPLVADLLQPWPDLQGLQRCHDGTIRKFLRQHHYRGGDEAIQKRIDAIRAAVPATNDPAEVEAHTIQARHLSGRMADLRDRITEVEKRRDELVATHPDSTIFASFPGAGRATVPRLIAAFGTRRERYESAFEVVCDSGIAPVHVRSGKMDRVSMRRASRVSRGRPSTSLPVKASPIASGPKNSTKPTVTARSSITPRCGRWPSKWIRILYRCWKDRKPYDEQLYLQSRRRRNGLLGPALATATSVEWKNVAGFSKLS